MHVGAGDGFFVEFAFVRVILPGTNMYCFMARKAAL